MQRPTPLEQWAATLPLSNLLACSIPIKKGKDPLRVVCELTKEEYQDVQEVFTVGLRDLFLNHQSLLKASLETMDEKSNSNITASKFATFSMSCGVIDDFHRGLSNRVGNLQPSASYSEIGVFH